MRINIAVTYSSVAIEWPLVYPLVGHRCKRFDGDGWLCADRIGVYVNLGHAPLAALLYVTIVQPTHETKALRTF